MMKSLIFLSKKRDEKTKGRMCTNGITQRIHIPKEKASSPTVTTEYVIITIVIDAKQERDVMSTGIPNALAQSKIRKVMKESSRRFEGS